MKKKIIASVLGFVMLLLPVSVHAQSPSEFIKQNEEIVLKISKEKNLFPSVMMAQAIIESGYGNSSLAANYNNYFGMKGEGVYMSGSSYQVFSSREESFRAYAENFYRNSHLYSKFLNANSPREALEALNGIYSTSNTYSDLVMGVIYSYDLYYLDNKLSSIIEQEQKEEKERLERIEEYKLKLKMDNDDIRNVAKSLYNLMADDKLTSVFNSIGVSAEYFIFPKEYVARDIERLYGISEDEALIMIKKFITDTSIYDKFSEVDTLFRVNALEFNKYYSK